MQDKIKFKDSEEFLDEETKRFRKESQEIIDNFTNQVLTNPIVNKWWKEEQERFRLKLLSSLKNY